jgi:zinc transport system permease protein
MAGAMGLSVVVALTGAVGSFYLDVPSGASIVVLAVLVFVVVTAAAAVIRAWQRRTAAGRSDPTPPAVPADAVPAEPSRAGASN